jgi:lysophospholipase L1-like esterase
MMLLGRFPLIKYRGELQARLVAQPVDEQRLGERYVRGHVRPRLSGHDPKPPGEKYDAPDDPAAVTSLRALLRRLRDDGVAVALVQPPQYVPTSGERRRERATIAAIARAAGVVYLDYNGALGGPLNRDASAFMDWAHLNRAGSQVFSRRLQADLKRHRFL